MNSIWPPPTNDCVMKAMIGAAQVSVQPATMPGIDSGSITVQKLRQLPTPSEAEASARWGSMRPIAVISGGVISGICTRATSVIHNLGVRMDDLLNDHTAILRPIGRCSPSDGVALRSP
jgi:hypothetical protein